jgi:oxaloacetate decarboxylase alpha subunit
MIEFDTLTELIRMLDETPAVSELSVSGPAGSHVVLKRSSKPTATAVGSRDMRQSPAPEAKIDDDGCEVIDLSAQTSRVSVVSANRVGLFRSAKPPIEAGSVVAKGQIVGYIEAIKLLNEVRSDVAGVIVGVLVENGTPVEYGQPLFHLSDEV